jgi:cytochrome c-type biogenesis protein CcmI
MSETVWIVVIASIGVLAIFSPFFSKQRNMTEVSHRDDLQHRKEQIFSQLADLEYDLYMNKISKHDYEQTKAELTERASNILDATSVNMEDVEKEVDEEIKQLIHRVAHFLT